MLKSNKIKKYLIFSILFIILIIISCSIKKEPSGISKNFGVDGANPEFINSIAELKDGISGVNGAKWETFEPDAPLEGKHVYKWNAADKLIEEIRSSGRKLQVNILFSNSWAMMLSDISVKDPTNGKPVGKYLQIKPEYINDWSDFISQLVTRYPEIEYLQIGSEEENSWINASGYVEGLCAAYDAAKSANPEIKVMAAGFNLGDFFALSEDKRELALQNDYIKQKFDFLDEFFSKEGRCFDVLSIHLDGGEKSIPGTVDYFKEQMTKNGYTKPIFSDDTSSGPCLGGLNPEKNEEKICSLAKNDKLRENKEDYLQFQEIQAELTTKKIVTAFYSGVERVFISSDTDFFNYYIPEWRYMGMIDYYTKIKKPVFYTYQMLVSKLDGFSKAEKIEEGYYKFSFSNKKPVYVLWTDGDEKIVNLQGSATKIVTRLDSENKHVYESSSSDILIVGKTPVIVESI